jgi:hypothetical protein
MIEQGRLKIGDQAVRRPMSAPTFARRPTVLPWRALKAETPVMQGSCNVNWSRPAPDDGVGTE